jgi:aryl-alcohol dehydrogenase-like predicted oxidoreductase
MEYRQLGTSDLIVSRICFGCWQLSPKFWGEVPLAPWHRAISRAAELGVNFIDTAGAYGDGYSEECLGNYLAEAKLRDQFMIATKVFWNFHAEERYPSTEYDFIVSECEGALKRLKTDRIDLWQIHSWDPLTRPDEVAAAMTDLKRAGKIRYAGVSNLNSDQMELYREYVDIVSLQPCYNMLERRIEKHELPYCQKNKIGVIPWSPLQRGILTGKYSRDTTFTDDRANMKIYQGKAFARILDGTDEVKKLADDAGITMPQFAIRWVLTQPGITSAIVGIKDEEQIETICPAVDEMLPVNVWFKAGQIMETAYDEAMKLT